MSGDLPCLVLTGPTAVGKTAALEGLAATASRPIEVISADAYQIYRGLDRGTAKPDPGLRARIPHHLIDIRDIDQAYSVGEFVRDASALLAEIRSRGHLPVITGGTVFYLKHLVFGLPEAPPSDAAVRASLLKELESGGAPALREELARVDPVSAARISPQDHYRLLRALEVWRSSGRALSEYAAIGRGSSLQENDFFLVALERGRGELVQRIAERVQSMFDAGLAEEWAALVKAGHGPDEPGMKAIGYREFFGTPGETLTDRQVLEAIVVHTRQYAKRQMTFLRSLPGLRWLDAALASGPELWRLWSAGGRTGESLNRSPAD